MSYYENEHSLFNFMAAKPFTKFTWPMGVGLTLALAGSVTIYEWVANASKMATPATESVVEMLPPQIVALGRLEPTSEVINLSVPLALDGDRVAVLYVKPGDMVVVDQVVATLDSHARLIRRMAQAEEQVQVAQQRLAQTKAGAKQGEIAAQRATLRQLEAELAGAIATQQATLTRLRSEQHNAQVEFDRFDALYQEGAVSASVRDSKRLALDTAQAQVLEAEAGQVRSRQTLQAQIAAARATLSKLTEVRPEDVAVAQAEVERALQALSLAKTELEQAQIRAPIAGQVLKIHAFPGEKVTDDGILELGQTEQMVVVAEVDESDIRKIHLGQSVTVVSTAFEGTLRGTVERIGQAVNKQAVFSNQPGANLDHRVIEVRITLIPKDSHRVASLTHLQVQTTFQLEEAP